MSIVYASIVDDVVRRKKTGLEGQMSLFDFVGEEDKKDYEVHYPNVEEFPKEVLLGFEKEVLGVYISGHPLEEYEERWRKNITARTVDFQIDEELGTSKAGDGEIAVIGGIITNKTLLKEAGYTPDDIKSFADLKKVAEDITNRTSELGFSAFTSAGMDGSSDWRFKTHLANLPIYFEYQTDGISSTDAIKGTYLDNYRDIWNLYINNSTCDPAELSAKTGDDSRNEFLAGDAVFFQNGSWEYGNLTGEDGYTDDDLAMIPIYIGAGDEANQGLCTGTENYWCVNNQADEADIQATLDFINWCVTSELGTKTMADDMGFVIPFKGAQESPNLFVKQDTAYTAEGKTPVSWNFTTMPSEEWKNGLGQALTAYAADQTDANWDAVVSAFVDGWATEYQLANGQ